LAPGAVNAHSHAFQRILRGRTEYLAAGRTEESFWTWRDLMYRAANRLSSEQIAAVSAMAFVEMIRSGITTVGEFHYLHGGGADPLAVDAAVIDAARQVGLRIALLRVAYQRAGAGRPALPDQARFVEPDVQTYLHRTEALRVRYRDDPLVTIGWAPHSVRAVPRSWLEAIAAQPGPIHIHACEQRRELQECIAEHGVEPVELLDQVGLLGPRTTLVHATHLNPTAHTLLARTGARVCACPTTERNLGDGFLPAHRLLTDGVRICLGSDSQADIDVWNEARLVEYHERLRFERRNVLAEFARPRADGRLATADVLWPMATRWGAESLSVEAGAIRIGAWADLITVDLNDVALVGAEPQTLRDQLVFATPSRAIRDVFVAGKAVMRDRVIEGEADIHAAFVEAMQAT
jgi:formimidoylglutamate deiminase